MTTQNTGILTYLRKYFKTQKTLFTVIGALFGATFPIGALLIDFMLHDYASLLSIYQANPLHFLIATAPIVLGFLAGLAGIRDDRIMAQTKEIAGINQSLSERAREMEDIMENIVQGILTINKDFTINKEYSTFIEKIFNKTRLSGINFITLLYSPSQEKERKELQEYLEMLFTNTTAEEGILKELNPIQNIEFASSPAEGEITVRYLHIDFVRIIVNQELAKIMVIIKDQTEEIGKERRHAREKQEHSEELEKISAIIRLPSEELDTFIANSEQCTKEMELFFTNISPEKLHDSQESQSVFSALHSLKGEARLYGFRSIGDKIHHLEEISRDFLALETSDWKNKKMIMTYSMEMMLQLSDLKIAINSLKDSKKRLMARFQENQKSSSDYTGVTSPQLLEQILPELGQVQNNLSYIMQLVSKQAGLFPSQERDSGQNWLQDLDRLLQDSLLELAKSGDLRKIKPIQLEVNLNGKQMQRIAALKPAVIHLVQNSLIHGIESPNIRLQRQKEEAGQIRLAFLEEDNMYKIIVEDDGGGIDLETIRPILIQKGVISPEKGVNLTLKEAVQMVFQPGFSSYEHFNPVAGRGIGTDAVRRLVRGMNGKISVRNRTGQGLCVTLLIPAQN